MRAAPPARHLDEAQRAEDAGGERRVRVALVVHRRGGAGEVEDQLGVDVDRLAHVAELEMEVRVAPGVAQVAEIAGHQVVDADDLEALGEQPIDEVRAEEAGRARHQRRPSRCSETHVNLSRDLGADTPLRDEAAGDGHRRRRPAARAPRIAGAVRRLPLNIFAIQ